MALRFYTSVAKGLKIKVIKLWELIHAFVKVTVEKLVGRSICPTPILNWVNKRLSNGAMLSQTEFFFVFEGISCRCHFNKTGLFSHCSVKWYLLFLLFNVVYIIWNFLCFFITTWLSAAAFVWRKLKIGWVRGKKLKFLLIRWSVKLKNNKKKYNKTQFICPFN